MRLRETKYSFPFRKVLEILCLLQKQTPGEADDVLVDAMLKAKVPRYSSARSMKHDGRAAAWT